MASTTELADALIACQDQAGTLAPITGGDPTFDVPRAYEVLAEINARREAQGWIPIGRKIGFTNRTIWERYGVYQPMWAPVWSHSVHFAEQGAATLPRDGTGVDRGVGSNVLGSPLNALAHLGQVLAGQPRFAPLASGEIVTTGTVTDAWPVKRGETWQSHYGSLGVEGLRLRLT